MLRIMGVAAALLAVACGSVDRTRDGGTPSHDGAVARGDAGSPLADDGPLPMPVLDPLELQRTMAAGTRLEVRAYALPDGSRDESGRLRLRDRGLDTLCSPIAAGRTFGGELRCLPNTNLVGSRDVERIGRFVDRDCSTLALRPRPAGCPPRFLTEVLTNEPTWPSRVFRDGLTSTGPVFLREGPICTTDPMPEAGEWTAALPLPESETVRGVDEMRAVGDFVEVTRTYDDGTVVLRRELAEPCWPVPFFGAVTSIQCVPGASPRTTPGLSASVEFLDADCTQPIVRITEDGLALAAANGTRFRHVIFDLLNTPEIIHPVEGEPFALGPEVYLQDDEEGCFSFPSGETQALRLGDAVPRESFPALRRVTTDGGRLRAYRWADDQGNAWPVPVVFTDTLGLPYLDRELNVDCAPLRTEGGLRCLPRLDQQLSESPTDGAGQLYADDACTVRIVDGPVDAADWYFERETVDDECRVTDLETTPAEQDDLVVVRAWAVGAAVGDAQTYRQDEGGRCRPFVRRPSSVLRRLEDEVPLSTFAEMSIEAVP